MIAGKFVWTSFIGKFFPEKWPTATALTGATVAIATHEINTQAEFDLTLGELAVKYPPPPPPPQIVEVAKGP